MRYILALLLVTFGLHAGNAHGAQQSADFPVGTVITVTDDGVTVVYDDGASSGSTGTTGSSGTSTASTDPNKPDPYEYGYCTGNDDSVADCRIDGLFDPWVAGTGERAIWIEGGKVEVFPFLLPSRYDADSNADLVRYGFLQFTAAERRRDPASEDVFHAWWSVEPNGAPLEGRGCEWWSQQARGYMYWTQDADVSGGACYLGTSERVLYLNYETRCYAPAYRAGVCNAETPQRSTRTYQFDVARRWKGY
jgi:hypothetical protein